MNISKIWQYQNFSKLATFPNFGRTGNVLSLFGGIVVAAASSPPQYISYMYYVVAVAILATSCRSQPLLPKFSRHYHLLVANKTHLHVYQFYQNDVVQNGTNLNGLIVFWSSYYTSILKYSNSILNLIQFSTMNRDRGPFQILVCYV